MEFRLKNNVVVLIDPEDYPLISQYKWHSLKPKKLIYIQTSVWQKGENKLKNIRLHRLIMNAPPGYDVDHINGDTLDNRKSNLRICTRSENLSNSTKHSDRKYDLPKGVELRSGQRAKPYYARLFFQGTRYNIGVFGTVEEAKKAYDLKSIELRGEYHRS